MEEKPIDERLFKEFKDYLNGIKLNKVLDIVKDYNLIKKYFIEYADITMEELNKSEIVYLAKQNGD